VASYFPRHATAHPRAAPHRAPWRVVPVGQVIPIPDDDLRRELLLVAYLHSADGARFTMACGRFRPLTAVDDHDARYQTELRGVHAATLLVLRPDPPRQIRWLDLTTAPGEPATRIDLDPPIPAPDVTVTRTAHSPGELQLDVIAARILCSGTAAFPPYDLEHPAAGAADLRAFIGDGPGRIVAALRALGALPPASPVPGQLAALCTRVGIPGHGITAPPTAGLPEPWQHMLTRCPARGTTRRRMTLARRTRSAGSPAASALPWADPASQCWGRPGPPPHAGRAVPPVNSALTWSDTTCPDGTDSNNDGGTCRLVWIADSSGILSQLSWRFP
jgi:hypothetical protein